MMKKYVPHICILTAGITWGMIGLFNRYLLASGFDPSFASCFDKKNVANLGGGMVICKFTGSRGKSGSNDANAEYLGHLRKIYE